MLHLLIVQQLSKCSN